MSASAAFALVAAELEKLFGAPPLLERSGGSVNAFDECVPRSVGRSREEAAPAETLTP